MVLTAHRPTFLPGPKSQRFYRCYFIVMLSMMMSRMACDQNYSQHMAIYRDKLDSAVYNTVVPPLLDQSSIMYVSVSFELLSIVQVDEVSQSFVCNGVLPSIWIDELLRWNPADYGGQHTIHPKISQIWRPEFGVINTIGDLDIFAGDYSLFLRTTKVSSDGQVIWLPGSSFSTSCELDLTNYPYDDQTCYIELIAINYNITELKFSKFDNVRTTFFTKGGEWDFLNGDVTIVNYTSIGETMSGILISFHIRRKYMITVISIVLPVVFLSFMNLLVFIIPVDSGEKIGYGVAVLLSLSVFMSGISYMLPIASNSVPKLTTYLFCLLVMAILTVIDSVIIVKLHHMEEREDKHLRAVTNLKNTTKIVTTLKNAVTTFSSPNEESSDEVGNSRPDSPSTSSKNEVRLQETKDTKRPYNKYKTIGKYIDMISFVVFFTIWIILTLSFMLTISGS